MSDDTRPTEDLANTQPSDVSDLPSNPDRAAVAADVFLQQRDLNNPLHWVIRRKWSLCGLTGGWGRGETSRPPSVGDDDACPVCAWLVDVARDIDMEGIKELRSRADGIA